MDLRLYGSSRMTMSMIDVHCPMLTFNSSCEDLTYLWPGLFLALFVCLFHIEQAYKVY